MAILALYSSQTHVELAGLGTAQCAKLRVMKVFTPELETHTLTGLPLALIKAGPNAVSINDFRGRSEVVIEGDVIRITLFAKPHVGRDAEPSARKTLRAVAKWKGHDFPTEMPEAEDGKGEDAIFRFGNADQLAVQIVTVPATTQYWHESSKGEKTTQLTILEAANYLRDAIRVKQRLVSKESTLLALDARHAAFLSLPQVIERLHSEYPEVRALGFALIWVVGPLPQHCALIAGVEDGS